MGAQYGKPHTMKLRPFAAACGTAFICLSVCPSVLAEESTQLEDVVITADRKARTVDETLTPVTVITRKDIEKYQATDVAEVLRRVPGVNIVNSGGVGKVTSVFLRGTNSSHVLVLVDGIKIGAATTGVTALQDVPLDQVERIEVVRGPRSSLYGSEAIGGVIQIFTRKGGKGFQPEISISAGSHNTQKANVNLAGGDKNTWYNLNAGTEKTDGINACSSTTTACFADEPDVDGYRRESVALRAGHRLDSGTALEASLSRSQGKNYFDGGLFSGNSNDFVQENFSGKLTHTFDERVAVSAQIGQSRDEAYNYYNGGDLSPTVSRQFDTRRNTAGLQTDITLNANAELTLGADTQKDNVISDNAYTVKSRKNDGVFASYQHDFGKTDVEISARSDDNEQFGKHNTGAVAIGYDISDNLRVKASQGKAFRAPTFNELYWPNMGNANLKPERSRNTEIGIDGKWVNGTWSVNAFDNKINDMIPAWPINNIDRATIRGVELGTSTQMAGWDVVANVTLQNPKNAAGTNAGKLLQRRPKQIANLDVDRKLADVRVGASIHAESERYDDVANASAKKLPGYGTLDLRADYQMAKDWTVGVKVGNVLDKDYQTAQGYNQDGINGLVTLKYAPK
jgi:vitamin B12 transporter